MILYAWLCDQSWLNVDLLTKYWLVNRKLTCWLDVDLLITYLFVDCMLTIDWTCTWEIDFVYQGIDVSSYICFTFDVALLVMIEFLCVLINPNSTRRSYCMSWMHIVLEWVYIESGSNPSLFRYVWEETLIIMTTEGYWLVTIERTMFENWITCHVYPLSKSEYGSNRNQILTRLDEFKTYIKWSWDRLWLTGDDIWQYSGVRWCIMDPCHA